MSCMWSIIVNEWELFKFNIYNLLYNWRLDRQSYLFSILFTYIALIGLPGLIIEFYNIFDELLIFWFGWIHFAFFTIVIAIISFQRSIDFGKLWVYFLAWSFVFIFFFYNPINFTNSIFRVTRDLNYISIKSQINLWVPFLIFLLLGIFPSENKKSKYGLPNGIIKTNWGYINYPFLDNWNKFWSEFSLYKVGPIISESLSIRVFNISKRISRGELIYYYISYQIIILIFVLIHMILIEVLPDILIMDYLLNLLIYLVYIWISIYMIQVFSMRLHYSGSSALWLFGLLIPYINIYVAYLLLGKGSWHFVSDEIE